MSNEKMFELIETFKEYLRYTGIVSPTSYKIAITVLDAFYSWFATQKENKNG